MVESDVARLLEVSSLQVFFGRFNARAEKMMAFFHLWSHPLRKKAKLMEAFAKEKEVQSIPSENLEHFLNSEI